MDLDLEGYEFVHGLSKKRGGGVAICVDKNINFRVLDRISTCADNMLECVSIELYEETNKSLIISFIYRTLVSNLEMFKDWMDEMSRIRVIKQFSSVETSIQY